MLFNSWICVYSMSSERNEKKKRNFAVIYLYTIVVHIDTENTASQRTLIDEQFLIQREDQKYVTKNFVI